MTLETVEYRVFTPGQIIPNEQLFRYEVSAIEYAKTIPGAIVQRRTIEEVWSNDGSCPVDARQGA